MITIRVRVILPSGETRDVELPLNTDIDHLYARLVARDSLTTNTERGEPIPYGFYHRRSARYLPAHVSLVDAGVENGDVLDVVPWPRVEPPLRALEEAHLYREQRYVPARWLLGYALAIIAIIVGVVLLAARQAGQPVTDFVDRNPLFVSIDPAALTGETEFVREDGEAGLIVRPDSLTALSSLSERKVSNPSGGVEGLSEIIGPVFEFVLVSEGHIVEPVVVKLHIPTDSLRDEADAMPLLSIARWDADNGRWLLTPTRVGRDGYLYAPTMVLGAFGVAQGGEALLWQERGVLEPGSYWGLHDPDRQVERTALARAADGWLSAAELAELSGLIRPDLTNPAVATASDLPVEGGALALSLSRLLDGPLAPDGSYVAPMTGDARPVAMGGDASVTEWKTVQVQAPIPYEDGLGWTVIAVDSRVVQRRDKVYIEYAADVTADAVAPVDFVWLVYSVDGSWTFARLDPTELESGAIELPAPPVRASMMVYGQPYEAWAVWAEGSNCCQHIFSVGAVSWSEGTSIESPPTEAAGGAESPYLETLPPGGEPIRPVFTEETPLSPTATSAQ